MKDLYLDCEWHRTGEIFLLGYAHSVKHFDQLYDHRLSEYMVDEIFNQVTGHVYIYGPDIKMIEKHFRLSLRKNFMCVNLLTAFRREYPGMYNYKLSNLEEYFKIQRKTGVYKSDINKLMIDWNNEAHRGQVLHYNKEDVVNMIRVKRKICGEVGLTRKKLEKYRLK